MTEESTLSWRTESIDRNLRSGPQSRENAISAARLAVVFRRIPCVARIVLRRWYSIISHRTLSEFLARITYSASTSSFSRRSPLGSQFNVNFSPIFRNIRIILLLQQFFRKLEKIFWNVRRNFVRERLDRCNLCGFASNISLWTYTYEFLQIIPRFYANSPRLNRQLYANLCLKLPVKLVEIFC